MVSILLHHRTTFSQKEKGPQFTRPDGLIGKNPCRNATQLMMIIDHDNHDDHDEEDDDEEDDDEDAAAYVIFLLLSLKGTSAPLSRSNAPPLVLVGAPTMGAVTLA